MGWFVNTGPSEEHPESVLGPFENYVDALVETSKHKYARIVQTNDPKIRSKNPNAIASLYKRRRKRRS